MTPQAFTTSIDFVGVRFKYPSAPSETLRGVDLRIRKGSMVGIVGASGAGKTTAVDLLLGLLEPTSGRIEVDGRDIRTNLDGWQRQVGYVPQFIYMTDDTLRRNIAIGVADAEIDEAAVRAAVDAAQLSELVANLPDGIDATIGERGVRLSGGQRQRIGIARALYHNPPVLVFDEATSALDHDTEREVVRAIDSLKGQRTIVVIAHRTTTVRNCDEIFIFDGGRVNGTSSAQYFAAAEALA